MLFLVHGSAKIIKHLEIQASPKSPFLNSPCISRDRFAKNNVTFAALFRYIGDDRFFHKGLPEN